MPNIHKMREKYAKLTPAQKKALNKKRAAFIAEVEKQNFEQRLARAIERNKAGVYRKRGKKKTPSKTRSKLKRYVSRGVKRHHNPAPMLYIITAKGTGKKMHYDGSKFSERARVVTFKTVSDAQKKAEALLRQYPVLRGYRVAVEHNQHLPK